MGTKKTERAVMVCTDKRGVFFGYTTDTTGDPIHLAMARMCVYWPAENRGVLGLASSGPLPGAKITAPVVGVELRGVTSVFELTPEAIHQ